MNTQTQNMETNTRSIERLQRERDVALARAEMAERACGEMRNALEHCRQRPHEHNPIDVSQLPVKCDVIDRALSTSCGVGYRSPEEVRRLVAPTIEFLGELLKVTEDFLDGPNGYYTKDTQAELSRLQRETGEKGQPCQS